MKEKLFNTMSDICDVIAAVSTERLMTLRTDLDYEAFQKLIYKRFTSELMTFLTFAFYTELFTV